MGTKQAEIRRKAQERYFLAFKRHFADEISYRKLGPEFGVTGQQIRVLCCKAEHILRGPGFADHPLRAFVGRLKMHYTE